MSFKVEVVVEIPRGSMFKYEVDEDGRLTVDRMLPEPLPYNYGFVPLTLHGDGDPLDVCIIGEYPIIPLTKVQVVIVGAFICDDNGESDDKLLAIVAGDEVDTNSATFKFYIAEVRQYLSTYKDGFVVNRYVDSADAYGILMKDLDAYINE